MAKCGPNVVWFLSVIKGLREHSYAVLSCILLSAALCAAMASSVSSTETTWTGILSTNKQAGKQNCQS